MLQMAFAQLESEITGYSTFLPEAVSGISTAVRGGVRNLFSDFAGRLQNKTGDSVAEAWQESLEKCQELLNLYPEKFRYLLLWGCFGFRRQREPAKIFLNCAEPVKNRK